ELRDEIRQRMQRDYDGIARQRLKRTLLDKLAERYDFPVPLGMVDMEFESIWREYQAQKERRREIEARAATDAEASEREPDPADPPDDGTAAGGNVDAPAVTEAASGEAAAGEAETGPVGEEDEKAKDEYRRIAERRVRLGLLLAEVGRNNNITVTQEEINQALNR